ncbi:MAG: 16S rRNA (cytosine(967)-C(5))-methyltransferase RsmB [Moraxellaceae bacterium]|nr:16S rRNA (cytosine(967)-C(5))-methyltransferase RsmB [Moraxellaceae bacterium]
MSKKLNVRALAAQALAPIISQQASLSSTLPPLQTRCPERDRGLLQNLVYGTAREWLYFGAITKPLLQKSLKDSEVVALLAIGVYQILRTRIPAHAAIAETVEAAKQLNLAHTAGLLNAVLRRFVQEQESLCANAAKYQHAHPEWLLKQLRKDWPQQADAIMAANNQAADLTLRINARQTTRADYLALLAAQAIEATPCAYSSVGIRLTQLADVTQLPLYAEGGFSVQDESAQLAAVLLNPAPNSIVLDACAAPAGKTAHLLEQADYAQLLAIDNEAKRVQRMFENLTRLKLNLPFVKVLTADASQPQDWVQDLQFDAILLDAPCTATGVIRRHPDIKLLRKASDVAQTVALQAQILAALWPTLKTGGRLLYATCSVLKAENEHQMTSFLHHHATAREIVLDAVWGEARPHGRQIFPSLHGGDGFYYCLLEKTA